MLGNWLGRQLTMRQIRDLFKQTAQCWFELNAPRLGAALAYYTMLAIAPLLVLCVSIAGLVFGSEVAQSQIVWQIQNLIGPQGGKVVQSLLLDALDPSHGIFAASVGLFMLLLGASGVFGELRDSLNLVWGVKSTAGAGLKGMIKYRFFSFAMVLGIGFLLLVSLVLSTAISAAGKFFGSRLPAPEPLLQFGSTFLSWVTVTILFALIYKVVPDIRIEWQDVGIGAAFTSFMFSLGKFLIGLYLGKAGVGSAYGAAGSLVVFLVWVYYSAQIFFFGAEFTRAFAERHGSRSQARYRSTTPLSNAGPVTSGQDAKTLHSPRTA
jgi:membrane protein